MIRAVVFDFAGVISTEGYMRWLKKNVPDLSEKMNYFMDASVIGDRGEEMDKYLSRLASGTGIPQDQIWPTMRKEFIIDFSMLKLIKTLKTKYKIGLLSNFTSSWLRELIAEENLSSYFDAITISSEINSVKPEAEIFNDMRKKLQVMASETVFIDDRSENVEGAERVGMKGIVFKSKDQLKIELINLGIIY